MSDKDDSVEMSEEIVVDKTPPNEKSEEKLEATGTDLPDIAPSCDNSTDLNDEMGQLKSKLKKLKGKKQEGDEEVSIPEGDGTFMCGVVEGFYGRPWTTGQRKELFRRMKTMGMNTYLYGPKDDYKHRLYWRDLYSEDETNLLKLLIKSAAEYDVLFIYAISPGLDMSFASPKELECLKNKLLQVRSLGCKAFALLFDDIDPILCAVDKAHYASAASAQAGVTNQMHETLGRPKFLFCPTEYCTSMAIPNVQNSTYLETIGKELNQDISVMWTGPKVVSKHITVEPIKQLTRIIRRKVVIWDNIHANDYDPKRMFLGPYKGRSTDLIPHLAGVLTNPNCEFESNYIAMYTLASWWKSCTTKQEGQTVEEKLNISDKKSDGEMECDDKKEDPEPSQELKHEEIFAVPQPSPKKSEDTKLPDSSNSVQDPVVEDAEDEQKLEKDEKDLDPVVEEQMNQTTTSEQGGPTASPVSSGVSSLMGSEDSDTDSDYSSHDDYYMLSRHSGLPPFDHGAYDPDAALKEAIKSWLPYFATSQLPLGKPIARSGPPLGMLSQCDVALVSSAPMGLASSTTNVLPADPISSSPMPCMDDEESSKRTLEVEAKHEDSAVDVEGPDEKTTDVEMSGATPSATPPRSTLEERKSEPEDVKMRSDSDIDITHITLPTEQHGGTGDVKGQDKKIETEMETEDEELMQTEADPDSDVSMATTNSTEEKKSTKDQTDEKESATRSSVDVTTTQISSANQTPERILKSLPEHIELVTDSHPQFKIAPMNFEDVQLAVELFYLPYEYGNFGRKMVQDFIWLQNNIRNAVMPPNAPKSVKNESMDKAMVWMERAIQFEDSCSIIRRMCSKLLTCSNRALLYDLFPYFWDMKGVVSMLSTYVKWLGQFYLRHQPAISPEPSEAGSDSSKPASPAQPSSSATTPVAVSAAPMPPIPPAAVWLGSDPEPWVFRGGLSGEFQRLLPVAMANDLFCQAIPCSPPPSTSTYTIRPYLASDEKAVYNICLTTGNDGTDFADDFTGYEDLPGERLVGGLLTLSPEYCFVVDDELGICGYLVGTADAKAFWKKYSLAFLPEVKEKYSSKEKDDKMGEEVKRFIDEIRSDEEPDSYAVDNLYLSHPAYMQIAVHRRVTDPSIAKSMTVCMLSALKSHGVHGVHTTVRSSDCYMPDLYCRLGFREIRPLDAPASPNTSLSSKEDTFIVFGRNF